MADVSLLEEHLLSLLVTLGYKRARIISEFPDSAEIMKLSQKAAFIMPVDSDLTYSDSDTAGIFSFLIINTVRRYNDNQGQFALKLAQQDQKLIHNVFTKYKWGTYQGRIDGIRRGTAPINRAQRRWFASVSTIFRIYYEIG